MTIVKNAVRLVGPLFVVVGLIERAWLLAIWGLLVTVLAGVLWYFVAKGGWFDGG